MSDEARPARPGYWAVIPAQIRYDDRIPPNAKILYAEISSLIGADGYCWATDEHFEKVFGFADRTVRKLMTALKETGYIRVEEERGQHNVLLRRRIYAAVNPLAGAGPEASPTLADLCQSDREDGATLAQKFRPLAQKIQSDTPTHIKLPSNNTNMPPIPPAARDELARLNADIIMLILEHAGQDEQLLQTWADFAEMRRRKHTPIQTQRTVELLIQKLRKLSGDDRVKQRLILAQSVERCWTGVFALAEDELPNKPVKTANRPIPTGKDVVWV